MNKLIVISGCTSGGKSTLISELSNEGYTVIHEVGREIVREQLAKNGNITPWHNPQAFCEMVIMKSIEAFKKAQTFSAVMGPVIFFDRSFLEGISYYQSLKIKGSDKYNHFIDELRYYPTIFMTPPWREIFCQDAERKNSFEDGVAEYQRLMKSYPEYGYHAVELPKISVKERIEFMLNSIWRD